ncbi:MULTISPECIES: ABC transporter substrate-binding protein [unclassified Bradyrhizobium]|uniref:ABC transporter substrate-binding protein n=1 Tax=unclassified Bradyrhizobium TaxID=2631580 RepID=UPI002479F663|nr:MULTISPECIES: ABC transporter substrate-binding protein [unclassified Bradyrhizobium]WGR69052.1 ABC transporter substrate-binding protein [Bradyrhizobium sp. ISRA426]WGR81107.1 ABC transporter substrate-binding protein [Bradyrhizobium sp. ISRA430]WGR84291.1 ABC transporter substrate-binding protein [Bradyrhizobium sp. ISRA432]
MAWPMRAWAQRDTKLPLVAVLFPGTEELFKPRVAAVRGGLKDEGMVEGRDYFLEARFASGDLSQLPRLAQELDALQPRVFVAAAHAVATVHSLRPDAPLVFTAMAIDPIAVGLAESYTRPGGTATGNVMNAVGGEESLTAKRLGFFRDLVPDIRRIGMIGVADYGLARLETSEEAALRKVTAQLGISFDSYEIKPTLDDLEAVLTKALGDGVEAFYVSGDPVLTYKISVVMPRILATGKPTFGPYPDWARAGLLLTYSSDAVDGFRRAGAYAAKIIRGANPGDLPIEQASKFWLVINLKTARQLGIKAPSNLLALADEVIE